MTKAELVDKVSQKIDLNRKETEVIVNSFFDCITQALSDGKKVELRGFGGFRVKKRKPRTGRNPKSGEKVTVPEKNVPFFKAGKELRNLVNKS
ncbi:MAG: integration host factor subunit beta [Nitrospinae bacterium]|nr:integration host factor subunit beta [Nitrospinota bacterium]